MVPTGGTHVRHPLAAKAARLLGVDFADAVTGFTFKGRHGTAVVAGVVVASQYKEAVENVIAGFEQQTQDQEEEEKSLECLRLWKRFLTGLRIAKRIGLNQESAGTDVEAEAEAEAELQRLREEMNEAEDEEEETFEAGGFFPDAGMDEVAQPTARGYQSSKHDQEAISIDGPRLRRKRRVQFDEEDDSDMEDAYEDEEVEKPRTRRKQPPRTRRKMVAGDDDEVYNPNESHNISDDVMSPSDQQMEDSRAYETEVPNRQDGSQDNYSDGVVFVPDGDDHESSDLGGGFLPDDEPVDDAVPTKKMSDRNDERDQAKSHTAIDTDETDDMGGGFIAEDRDIQPIVSGGLPSDIAAEGEGGDCSVDDQEEETGGGSVVGDEHAASKHGDSQVRSRVDAQGGDIQAEDAGMDEMLVSSPSEHGSLLSHDPDDDDAEPEWLV